MIDPTFDPETYRPTLREVSDLIVTVVCTAVEQLTVEDEIATRVMQRIGGALEVHAERLEPRYQAMVSLVGKTLVQTATDGTPGYDD